MPCMWFFLVPVVYGLYRFFALVVFVVVIWPKRDDSEHVRRMADAYARVAWPLKRRRRWGP